MIDQMRANDLAVPGQKIQNTRWNSRFLKDLHEHRAAYDRLLGWFHDHCVACHDCGRCHSAKNRDWKIPWRNHEGDATWPVMMIAFFPGNLLRELRASEPAHLLRVEPAKIDRLANIAIGFIPSLAYFEDFDRRELVAPTLPDVGRAFPETCSFFKWRPAPSAKCRTRSFHGAFGFGNPCFGPVTDDFVRSARIDRWRQLIGPGLFTPDDERILFPKAFAYFAQCALHFFLVVFVSEIHKRCISIHVVSDLFKFRRAQR